MLEMKCPKCRSGRVSQERRIDGDAICLDCHHRGKPEEFRRKTNFDRLTESPEALAKEMVFCHGGLWGFIRYGIPVIRMKRREDAIDMAIEYFNQEDQINE